NFARFRADSSRKQKEVDFRKSLATQGRQLVVSTMNDMTIDGMAAKTKQPWLIDANEAVGLGLADSVGTYFPTTGSPMANDLAPAEGDSWETRKAKAKLRKARAQAELLQLGERLDKAQTDNSNCIFLFDPIFGGSILKVQQTLQRIAASGTSKEVD